MTIIEDGTGLPDANSYASLEDANAYFEARNIIAWDEAEAEMRDAALIRATDYIDANYAFRSVPRSDTQGLEYPRDDDATALPRNLVRATFELALIALNRDLFALEEREIKSTSESLGSLSTRTDYADAKTTDPFPAITAILKSIARRKGAGGSSMSYMSGFGA